MAIEYDGTILNLYNKDEEGHWLANLTWRKWKETAVKINHHKVKSIRMVKVNVGECCRELFDFISKCINCTRLLIDNVIDNTDKNSDLSHHLSAAIKNLTRLIKIDIRDTNLSRGWREVLSSIASPHIRLLLLYDDDLEGQGEVLEDLLTKLPQLRCLNLNGSSLGGEEMLGVLYQLPIHCPHIQGLMMGGQDLSMAGDRLVQALTGLPRIRGLNIENCKLKGTVLSNILHQINTHIEFLCINDNEAVPDTGPSVFDYIKQCQSLQYLEVSSRQFTKTALSQLDSSLSAHGGHLLVDATTEHKELENLIYHISRICEESLYD